jgi:hypothetical protein
MGLKRYKSSGHRPLPGPLSSKETHMRTEWA